MKNELKREPDPNTKYYVFLDGLRESGITNMFGATSYIVQAFGVSTKEARNILKAWMSQFKLNK